MIINRIVSLGQKHVAKENTTRTTIYEVWYLTVTVSWVFTFNWKICRRGTHPFLNWNHRNLRYHPKAENKVSWASSTNKVNAPCIIERFIRCFGVAWPHRYPSSTEYLTLRKQYRQRFLIQTVCAPDFLSIYSIRWHSHDVTRSA